MSHIDTIAAVATAPGRGGVGVVRISGPLAADIAAGVCGRKLPPREACFSPFRDAGGALIDRGIALHFAAPASYTGEDVVELQGHGGPVVLDLLLARCLALGARPARPGEFTERAFLNGKLDLAQAEAVADLIESGSAAAARAATRSLEGEFSRRVQALVAGLIELRSYVEAALDFSEEEIDFLADGELLRRCDQLLDDFGALFVEARRGELLRDGMTVVIAGQPNVGKSSLLNRLAGRDSAIVTAQAGTTRDLLREHIHLDGMPLHLIDTAGLRESDDPVEREGVRRARQALQNADRVLLVSTPGDSAASLDLSALPAELVVDRVINKIDLCGDEPGITPLDAVERGAGDATEPAARILLSAKSGAGIGLLREHLKRCAGFEGEAAGSFSARRRHLDALQQGRERLVEARDGLAAGLAPDLTAEELRLAQRALGQITGEITADDLLGSIFSSFCIGK